MQNLAWLHKKKYSQDCKKCHKINFRACSIYPNLENFVKERIKIEVKKQLKEEALMKNRKKYKYADTFSH